MAIPFSVVARPNPNDRSLPPRFFGNARTSGELTTRELADRIGNRSTVSPIDTMAMLEALFQVIPEALSEGLIVRLGDLGNLRVFLGSDGSDSAEEFDSSLIKEVRLVFRPGPLVRSSLSNTGFQRVEE